MTHLSTGLFHHDQELRAGDRGLGQDNLDGVAQISISKLVNIYSAGFPEYCSNSKRPFPQDLNCAITALLWTAAGEDCLGLPTN